MAETGAEEVVFADTIGVAVPRQVTELIESATGLGPSIGVHSHNTRNAGYANALTAIEAGAELLDTAIGGLGGCPFAPRASGNIATEDVVYVLEREGIDTGVDLDELIYTAEWLRTAAGLSGEGQLKYPGPFPAIAAGKAVDADG